MKDERRDAETRGRGDAAKNSDAQTRGRGDAAKEKTALRYSYPRVAASPTPRVNLLRRVAASPHPRVFGSLSSFILHPSSLPFAAHLCVCVALLCAWSLPAGVSRRADAPARRAPTAEEIDAALQRAATLALDGREGTVILMDAQDGRLRAVVNERLAAEVAFPPGSAVKPFTLLAALRAGVVDANTRLLCRKHYRRGATQFTCSHPVYKTLFDPPHALAHSCNYFFAHLGERLSPDDFSATLASFGFGDARHANASTARSTNISESAPHNSNAHATHSTNARASSGANSRATHDHARALNNSARASDNFAPVSDNFARALNVSRVTVRLAHRAISKRADFADEELAPQIPHGEWHTETALGEGGAILATPLQMITAYAALVNGGRLFETQRAPAANFNPRERARLAITDKERALIVAGMRGAVLYGTAERARLDALPLRIFGKTGTATEIGGFRTHGWFVGFASDARTPRESHAHAASRDAHAPSASSAQIQNDSSSAQLQSDSSPDQFQNDQPAPSEVRLAVLVFLKRAQGKECAALARPIFEEYARLTNSASDETSGAHDAARTSDESEQAQSSHDAQDSNDAQHSNDANASGDATSVRVRLARDGETRTMPLDEYLFGVLAAEASTEDEFAAIKTLAVVSRTYALQKLGRHTTEGFDFCTTTHCQRYLGVNAANARPDFHALLRRAVSETTGEVLRDSHGHLADAYFSANCGGMTANVQTLWGTPAREPFERGVADEYCVALPQTRWTDAIPARELLMALRADPRSDVGARLTSVNVIKRDATGRAELIALEGERRKILRGWDFKIIVGRTLGWNMIKSSRFSVERAGQTFVFRGTGFGHGLGLCQAGAHVMARGGSSYLQILAHYFPGASVGQLSNTRRTTTGARSVSRWKADATAPLAGFGNRVAAEINHRAARQRRDASPLHPASLIASSHHFESHARLTLASEHFRVSYPARGVRDARRAVETVLRTLEAARADIAQRLDAASLSQPTLPALEINVNETTADFVAATGQPSWVAAATRGARIELQPLATLERRGTLAQTLRHEYAHACIEALSRGRAPLWLAEGLATHFAGEGALLARRAPAKKISTDELERKLKERASPDEARALYATAYAEVRALIRSDGEPRVWRRVAGR
jgi:stage II sporulation protein D